jgi:adenosylcobinamide-GDP ribazoletransferase
MKILRRFLDTLGFLTRLAPARVIPEEDMNQCMRYMIAVGITLGAIIVLPFALGLFSSSPWVQAWLMVVLNIYLTRGLHYDGLADVCDAVTTHTDPKRFWEVIKDSRSGAFGIIGLIMALGGQILLFHEILAAGAYVAILWTFILGRATCVWLGFYVRHLTRPGLGKLYIDGATLGVALATAVATFAIGILLIGPIAAITTIAIATATLIPLYRLAVHVNGANGDFLGCSVLLGELAAGLGIVLFL